MIPIDSYAEFEQLAGGLASLATLIAIVATGAWAYLRFVRQQEHYSHIVFTADINFICKQGGYWIVELISDIENVGKVPHKFKEFEFDLCALLPDDEVKLNDEFGGQAWFPHQLARGSWRNPKYGYFFIAPGTKAKYSYVTRVRDDATAIMLHSWFRYEDRKKAGHAAERTKKLPVSTAGATDG